MLKYCLNELLLIIPKRIRIRYLIAGYFVWCASNPTSPMEFCCHMKAELNLVELPFQSSFLNLKTPNRFSGDYTPIRLAHCRTNYLLFTPFLFLYRPYNSNYYWFNQFNDSINTIINVLLM
uniref:Uncharacterized protein n=1 Tax=Glossina pallidipes TaxID=7398 RepID=A0A1A9ZIV8_GLOPL